MAPRGAAGNSAVDIYAVVDDPKNASCHFDLVLAPLAITQIGTITKLANIRRRIKEAHIARLGDHVKRSTDTIDKVNGLCRPDLE
jgi:hypothetical protein